MPQAQPALPSRNFGQHRRGSAAHPRGVDDCGVGPQSGFEAGFPVQPVGAAGEVDRWPRAPFAARRIGEVKVAERPGLRPVLAFDQPFGVGRLDFAHRKAGWRGHDQVRHQFLKGALGFPERAAQALHFLGIERQEWRHLLRLDDEVRQQEAVHGLHHRLDLVVHVDADLAYVAAIADSAAAGRVAKGQRRLGDSGP